MVTSSIVCVLRHSITLLFEPSLNGLKVDMSQVWIILVVFRPWLTNVRWSTTHWLMCNFWMRFQEICETCFVKNKVFYTKVPDKSSSTNLKPGKNTKNLKSFFFVYWVLTRRGITKKCRIFFVEREILHEKFWDNSILL